MGIALFKKGFKIIPHTSTSNKNETTYLIIITMKSPSYQHGQYLDNTGMALFSNE